MAQSSESEDSIEKTHQELCTQLNVDSEATLESWKSYETINQKYTLDGEPIHWIGCALYVACRKSLVPTVGRTGSAVEGNCVSLTKLLRLCNISLIQFFNTIKKWIDMASMPEDFRLRVEKLEKNFAVSTVLFQKFKPIFLELFVPLENVESQKSNKGNKKTKLALCNVNAVFEFCWCLFVCVKGEFPCLSDDLVNMYHVLLSCIDLVYGNAIMAQRRDLINPNFKGLPANWSSPNFEPPSEPPCVISVLCDTFQGLYLEAKSMKQYAWKTVITKFFNKSILKGDEKLFTGLLDLSTFDFNLKSLNKVYETFVLSVGEFDERIFLGEQGTPSKTSGSEISKAIASFPPPNIRSLVGDTPLTGRRHLKHKSELLTPVSSATNSVEKLYAYLTGCTNSPSASLLARVKDCKENTMEELVARQKDMGALFLVAYAPLSSEEMAGTRLNLAEVLYYRLLEQIILDEIRKKPHVDLQCLLSQEIFHQTLFACCVEIVVYTYGFQNARFPWVLDCFKLDAFYFYKIIEIVVLVIKEKLSRDMVKHLNTIEEQVLESLAWSSNSPIWQRIQTLGEPIPPWSEVSAGEQVQLSTPQHTPTPSIRRPNNVPGVSQSPVSSAADRFLSPGTELAKKQLFKDSNIKPGQSLLNQNLNNHVNPSTSNGKQTAKEGTQVLKKVIKAGSLGLFFRKFYCLAVVRMNDLCKNLRLDDQELKQKIWTCLEHSIIHNTHLMKDRHLDQILMCAIYVICKVTNSEHNRVEQTFTEIMRCYRQQPQATGHVYRSVLISQGPASSSNNNENEGGDVARAPVPRSPPSPSRPAGQSVRHASQERGDLIKFYNTVYVMSMQQFALRFSRAQPEECALSPLPPRESGGTGPQAPRRVSEHHRLYVRPLSHSTAHQGPPMSTHLTYRFSRSPAKDLQDINCLMSQESVSLGKRASDCPAPPSFNPAKKSAALNSHRKITHLIIDRQAMP